MRSLLDIRLLSQSFGSENHSDRQLEDAKHIAQLYTKLENSISVLSDMKVRKSYIHYGVLAEEIGLRGRIEEIDSIWEDELLSRVHPEDLQRKYRLEFQFFQLLKSVRVADRTDYGVVTRLRIRNREGNYIGVRHRLIYIASSADGSIWLALCLYNRIYDHPGFDAPSGVILNTRSGEIIEDDHFKSKGVLSLREKEILQLIGQGRRSKEIAGQLSLSINTVNRHRQNIFQKLNVTNAIEACRIAAFLGS